VFLLSIFLLLLPVVIYPLGIIAIARLRCNSSNTNLSTIHPEYGISIIIPAYNEEKVIEEKLINTLSLNYPDFEIIVVSDGSSDKTETICRKYNVKLVSLKKRKGKIGAIKTAAKYANKEILLISDANIMLEKDFLAAIIQKFNKSNVGAVYGNLRIIKKHYSSLTNGEIFYWKFEHYLRIAEQKLGFSPAIIGGTLAIRRDIAVNLLFPVIADDTICEDLEIALKLYKMNYKIAFAEKALAYEDSTKTSYEAFLRRTRLTAGGLQSFFKNTWILRKPLVGFSFFFHKLLRWIMPIPLLIIIGKIYFNRKKTFLFKISYLLLKFLVLLPISEIIIGYLKEFLTEKQEVKTKFFSLPFFFMVSQLANLIGILKFLLNKEKVTWRVVSR